jgi:hypothetical protein
MAVDLAFITDLASEFANVDPARVDRLVAIWAPTVNVDQWGDQRDLALGYLICHVLKIDAQGGNGAVTSEKIGDITRSYARAGSSDKESPFASTSYGQMFLLLQSQTCIVPMVT